METLHAIVTHDQEILTCVLQRMEGRGVAIRSWRQEVRGKSSVTVVIKKTVLTMILIAAGVVMDKLKATMTQMLAL